MIGFTLYRLFFKVKPYQFLIIGQGENTAVVRTNAETLDEFVSMQYLRQVARQVIYMYRVAPESIFLVYQAAIVQGKYPVIACCDDRPAPSILYPSIRPPFWAIRTRYNSTGKMVSGYLSGASSALMTDEVNPVFSSSFTPFMVMPPGVVTRSICC